MDLPVAARRKAGDAAVVSGSRQATRRAPVPATGTEFLRKRLGTRIAASSRWGMRHSGYSRCTTGQRAHGIGTLPASFRRPAPSWVCRVCATDSIGPDEIAEVVATLESGWLTTGPRVAAFERELRRATSARRYALAVNSCTAALHLSLLAAGVGTGDEVITTPLTFCATANVIVPRGATPGLRRHRSGVAQHRPGGGAGGTHRRARACMLPVHYAGLSGGHGGARSDRANRAVCASSRTRRTASKAWPTAARSARSATSPVSVSTRPRTSRPAKAAW